MQDVFLSYAREDRERAVWLVDALERSGLAVWWDRDLVTGQNWQRELESAVRQARCVVVLWGGHSVASDYVREEASLAREEGKLVPALLDDVEIPMPFRLIQTADLKSWRGEEDHEGLSQLVSGVRARCGEPRGELPSGPGGGDAPKTLRDRWLSMAWLVLPTLAVAASAFILMKWPAPTEVDIEAIATSVQFRGHGSEKQPLLESMAARWIALQGFDEIRLAPAAVWIADPAKYDFEHDTYLETAWKPAPPGQSLVLHPAGRDEAAITIRPLAKSDAPLALGRLFGGSAGVRMGSPERGSLSVELQGQKVDGDLWLPADFRVDADRCVREGDSKSRSVSTMTFKVRLSESSRLLEYSSQRRGVRVAVGYPSDSQEPFLGQAGFAVDQVAFLRQGVTGQPESTIAGAGVIRYPQYPAIAAATLSKGDFLSLSELRGFHLRQIAPGKGGRGLQMSLGGVAGKIHSGPAGSVRDRRVTHFSELWQNRGVTAFFTILAWLVPTLIAGRNLYRDMRGAK